jgi:hypothetical protein
LKKANEVAERKIRDDEINRKYQLEAEQNLRDLREGEKRNIANMQAQQQMGQELGVLAYNFFSSLGTGNRKKQKAIEKEVYINKEEESKWSCAFISLDYGTQNDLGLNLIGFCEYKGLGLNFGGFVPFYIFSPSKLITENERTKKDANFAYGGNNNYLMQRGGGYIGATYHAYKPVQIYANIGLAAIYPLTGYDKYQKTDWSVIGSVYVVDDYILGLHNDFGVLLVLKPFVVKSCVTVLNFKYPEFKIGVGFAWNNK